MAVKNPVTRASGTVPVSDSPVPAPSRLSALRMDGKGNPAPVPVKGRLSVPFNALMTRKGGCLGSDLLALAPHYDGGHFNAVVANQRSLGYDVVRVQPPNATDIRSDWFGLRSDIGSCPYPAPQFGKADGSLKPAKGPKPPKGPKAAKAAPDAQAPDAQAPDAQAPDAQAPDGSDGSDGFKG